MSSESRNVEQNSFGIQTNGRSIIQEDEIVSSKVLWWNSVCMSSEISRVQCDQKAVSQDQLMCSLHVSENLDYFLRVWKVFGGFCTRGSNGIYLLKGYLGCYIEHLLQGSKGGNSGIIQENIRVGQMHVMIACARVIMILVTL